MAFWTCVIVCLLGLAARFETPLPHIAQYLFEIARGAIGCGVGEVLLFLHWDIAPHVYVFREGRCSQFLQIDIPKTPCREIWGYHR